MHLLALLSMRNRALIALVTVVVAVFGGLALTGLKQELAPSITFPQLAVITQYRGASPEVVTEDVSTPLEAAIQGIEGVESTSSTSSTNLSIVSARFEYGTDLVFAEQKVAQAIGRIRTLLPEGLDPRVLSGSISDLPVLQLSVTGADTDALTAALRETGLADIEQLAGVREASLVGVPGQRVTVRVDPAALAARGLTSADVRAALQQSGSLLPAGEITAGESTFAVQAGARLGSVEEIAALPLVPSGPPAGPVAPPPTTIGEVAAVEAAADPRTSVSRVNGEPAVTVSVTKLPAANTVEVSQEVRAALPDIARTLGDDVEFTVVFDQAPYIEESIESLTTEGLLGLVFAVLVILVFLMSIRSTLVTAISIPTSVLITFIGLQSSGYTLNILTLGALTISIGRVVDDSIVVIENIKRHLGSRPVSDQDRAGLIVEAVREVATAITASTITTVAVFLPIAFVEGVTGELFRPFSLTVTIALLASLLVALTIVPVLAYWFLRPSRPRALRRPPQGSGAPADEHQHTAGAPAPADEHQHRHAAAAPALVEVVAHDSGDPAVLHGGRAGAAPTRRRRRATTDLGTDESPSTLQRGYLPIIRWTLQHSVLTLLAAVLVLAGTVALVPGMKTNFLGDSGQNTFQVTQSLPPGTSLAAQDAAAAGVEDVLLSIEGIETVQVSVGSSGSVARDAFFGGGGSTTFSVTTEEDADPPALQEEVREAVEGLEGAGEVSVQASSGFGASSDIEVDITAADRESLEASATRVVEAIEELDVASEVSSNLSASRPYIEVRVDRALAAAAGYSETALASLVAGVMQPQAVSTVTIEGSTLTVYLDTGSRPDTLEALSALEIPTPGGPVRLDSLAVVQQVDGPATITSERGRRSATVSITPSDEDLGTASAQVQQALDGLDLPPGVNADLGGVTANQQESFGQLGLALLAAILIVYIIMVATFRSLLQPLLLLVSVPFAATGAILLQVVTGIPLGVPSLVGVLMLIGIVVTNAIVLIDLVNQYRDRGLGVRAALELGAARRLRPILMTALATIFALVPMALGITGGGGFISQPLALVVIGGLVSSTLLTLVVLPVLYNLVEGARERRSGRRHERLAARSAASATATAPSAEAAEKRKRPLDADA